MRTCSISERCRSSCFFLFVPTTFSCSSNGTWSEVEGRDFFSLDKVYRRAANSLDQVNRRRVGETNCLDQVDRRAVWTLSTDAAWEKLCTSGSNMAWPRITERCRRANSAPLAHAQIKKQTLKVFLIKKELESK